MCYGLGQYITYNEGNSHFVGNFQPYDSFCESISTTLSFNRYEEPTDVNFYATFKMDINSIGDHISNSDDVYWVLTLCNGTITCSDGLDFSYVIFYGRFNGINDGDTIV